MAKCCAVCGRTLGIFAGKAETKDGGYVCEMCLKQGDLYYSDAAHMNTQVLVTKIRNRMEMKKRFRPNRKCSRIEVDTKLCVFKLCGDYYPFSKLITYSYREDPENKRVSQHDGRAGGAVVGGIIGGLGGGFVGRAVGATVGAAVGNKVGGMFSSVCNYMYIKLALDDKEKPEERLYFIDEKTRVTSDEYRDALEDARDCLEVLEVIVRHNDEERKKADSQKSHEQRLEENKRMVFVQNGHMSAEEINRELTAYMAMKAGGLITEEEYNEKKKQLLSLNLNFPYAPHFYDS